MALDGAYPPGGYPITAANFGLTYIDRIIFPEENSGLTFQYVLGTGSNQSNTGNIKVFMDGIPPIIWQENQTIGNATTANQFTLNYPPAYIFYAGIANVAYSLVDQAATLAANQMQFTSTLTFGNRTPINTYAGNGSIMSIGYITQAWKMIWDNLVQNENQTTAANVATLASGANGVMAIENCRAVGTTATNVVQYLPHGATAASHQAKANMTASTLTFNATDAVTSCITTYVKLPASGMAYDRMVVEQTPTVATALCTPNSQYVLVWSFMNQIAGLNSTNIIIEGMQQTPTAGAATFTLSNGLIQITAANGATANNVSCSYVWGREMEIQTIPMEAYPNANIAYANAVPYIAIGS
jgi:hypothetical protein